MVGCGSSPPPAARMMVWMAASKRPVKERPTPPGEDVVEKIDPKHSDEDWFEDLAKASSNDARRKLGLPAVPER